ncbi:probable carboxylesterase 17 [Rhododendron vialii]|uniref:probable carboxylesterase 17 n=1 Tax=Rhododendron vialii TaxID=182163 RepID=UPI00265F3218|nr:probable carboxylesterase 17 [Rhododendron vialii]
MSIVAEAPGFLQVFSDGSVKRFAPVIANASSESSNGYKFKDVIIDPSKSITARIFLPDERSATSSSSPSNQLLPVIVYFHGGGFCIGSTTWLGYHVFLGSLSVTSQSIVLSVDYRLAPENRLPIAYEDCYTAIEWLVKEKNLDSWLERANLSRTFLSGESAGGNITHQVAITAIRENLCQTFSDCHLEVKGLLLIHPFFGSERRTNREMAEGAAGDVAMNDMFWGLSLPEGSNRDFYGCNFETAPLETEEWGRFPPVVVFVAGVDFLKERGVMYAEFLQGKGVKGVELVEAEGEPHIYHVYDPESEASRLLQKQMREFIHSL